MTLEELFAKTEDGFRDTHAAANLARKMVLIEREICARLASGMGDGADCDDLGTMDLETGEVPCFAERRGEVCICVERSDLAHKIATKIRARSI